MKTYSSFEQPQSVWTSYSSKVTARSDEHTYCTRAPVVVRERDQNFLQMAGELQDSTKGRDAQAGSKVQVWPLKPSPGV